MILIVLNIRLVKDHDKARLLLMEIIAWCIGVQWRYKGVKGLLTRNMAERNDLVMTKELDYAG